MKLNAMAYNKISAYFEAAQKILDNNEVNVNFSLESRFNPEPTPDFKKEIATFSPEFIQKIPPDIIQQLVELWERS